MESIFDRFGHLVLADPTSLTYDERVSLEYFEACMADMDGERANTDARRWMKMRREVGRVTRTLGRLPVTGDAGIAPRHLRWLEDQRTAVHCSLQLFELEQLPGWSEYSGVS